MRHRAPAHPETRDDVSDPAAGELAAVQEELLLERDRHLRTRADFENYRRRVERDREAAGRQARRDLLRALVDLADGFDRALAHLDESPASVAAGVRGMQRGLRTLLDAEGVTPFESVGQIFDPVRHEAIATVRDAGVAPGTVVDESARGYLWNGDLLRPAQVRVAS
jgi:molecular chaperone GrpE